MLSKLRFFDRGSSRLAAGGLLALTVFASTAAAHAASPVALASSASGGVQVKPSGDGSFRPLRLFQKLSPGDQVRCEGSGEAVLTMVGNGTRYKVPAGAVATVTEDGVQGGQKASALRGPTARVWSGMGAASTSGLLGRAGVAPRPILKERSAFNGYYVLQPGSPTVFRWEAEQDPNASVAHYGFTLYDVTGEALYHAHTEGREATYPADGPALTPGQPYVWRIVPYGKSGKEIRNLGARWGVVTWLKPETAAELETQVKELEAQQSSSAPGDTSALVTLAFLYKSYNVYARALEVLNEPAFSTKNAEGANTPKPGVDEMIEAMYEDLGPAAVRFAHPFEPKAADKLVVGAGE